VLFPSVNKQKSWLLFLLFILGGLNLYFHFSFDGVMNDRGRWVDHGLSLVTSPIRALFQGSRDLVVESTDGFMRLRSVDAENQEIKGRVAQLEVELQRMAELSAENQRFKTLLDFKEKSKLRLLPARIISRDMSMFMRSARIDRGSGQGVERGMAVVSPQGVVGQVDRVFEGEAIVQFLTDLNSRLDGVVERSRTQVIVGGSMEGDMKLYFLARRADVRQGDVVFSSGTGSIFPAGFKIGTIVGHSQDPDAILEDAELEPAVSFGALEEIFVVLHKQESNR
jgi:rod shape-determining protein MreC